MKKQTSGSVLWITGLSGAGKTTVGKLLTQTLRNAGAHVFWLDGDEMRKVLGAKWGYTAKERMDLAHVYSRLAAKLAENGTVVVCSVVALFQEVRLWNRENIPNYFEVYLRVPISELAKRDTKGHYKKFLGGADPESVVSDLYEMPDKADIIIDNFGIVEAKDSARHIIDEFLSQSSGQTQQKITSSGAHIKNSIKSYWDNYYKNELAPTKPSSFALFCKQNYIEPDKKILEVGCGNGRDSFYLSQSNPLVAIDASETAIANNKKQAKEIGRESLKFICGFFGDDTMSLNENVDYFYSRFVFHAMDETLEDNTLSLSSKMLNPGGLFLAEFRTSKDPLFKKGVAISQNERITDHYRRFIDAASIVAKLDSMGFEVLYSVESKGLAVCKNDDPVVARIVARVP